MTTCNICEKSIEQEGICQRCAKRIHTHLDDIGEFWIGAHSELLPGRTGSGSQSSERTLGVNIQALSFIAGDDILGICHEWEKVIREGRNLTPPALIEAKGLGDEIKATLTFHATHLEWSGKQEWIGEFAREIRELHQMGLAASRSYVERVHRIACPTQLDDSICGNLLTVNKDDPLDIFTCPRCDNHWNTLRLVSVAMDSKNEIWLDAEAIGIYFQMNAKSVKQFARRKKVAKRGSLYDLIDFQAKR